MNAVHTSAPAVEADMFGGAPVVHRSAEDVFEIPGTLLKAAEVRTKPVGHDGLCVPVLCMEIRPLSGIKRTLHAEQVYTESTRQLAEQKAATLRRGDRVTVTSTLADMRWILPHVQSVANTPVL